MKYSIKTFAHFQRADIASIRFYFKRYRKNKF